MLDSLKFCLSSKNLKQIPSLTTATEEPLTICSAAINVNNIQYTTYNIQYKKNNIQYIHTI